MVSSTTCSCSTNLAAWVRIHHAAAHFGPASPYPLPLLLQTDEECSVFGSFDVSKGNGYPSNRRSEKRRRDEVRWPCPKLPRSQIVYILSLSQNLLSFDQQTLILSFAVIPVHALVVGDPILVVMIDLVEHPFGGFAGRTVRKNALSEDLAIPDCLFRALRDESRE